MVDAVEDLEKNLDGKGKDLVGKCKCTRIYDLKDAVSDDFDSQTLRIYKIKKREPLQETSGARKILGFSTQR